VRISLTVVLVFVLGCSPEPDLLLPLRAPIRIVAECPRPAVKVAVVTAPPSPRQDPAPPPGPLQRPSPLRFERRRSSLSEPEINRLFDAVLERRRSAYKYFGDSRCGQPEPWMSWMVSDGLLQGDLFSDLYPETAQRRALDLLRDEESYVFDLHFALLLIKPSLAPLSEELHAILLRLATHHDTLVQIFTLYLLGEGGAASRYRPLFRSLCLEGVEEAFDQLSLEPDPETTRFMEGLSRSSLGVGTWMQWVPFRAKLVLDRLALLDSPDWKSKIEAILLRPIKEREEDETVWWARSVAWARHPAPAIARNRRYIEMMRKKMAPSFRQSTPTDRPSFAECCLRGGGIPGVDMNFDVELIGYAKDGGELQVWEAHRLEYFGYLGDREARLQEILKPGFRW
jgi:hypothetical protein